MITESVSNTLLECRQELSLTREQVSEAVQIDPKTLYRYENNMAYPKIDAALRLARYYHKSVNELFRLKNE